jgi:hypothetical protein
MMVSVGIILVHFEKVGRDHATWDAEVRPSASAIVSEARRGGKLMSRDVWIAAGDAPGRGVILAGCRQVGQFWTKADIAFVLLEED